MCGIAGILSHNADSLQWIGSITNSLAHRGPDANGTWIKQMVALGHRRLSIIDLDARSNQPFHSGNGRYTITFNGEIYNFKRIAAELVNAGVSLRTASDTEVLVEAFALWGIGFVQKLEGMFALAIYDTLEQKLYLYRDRVGKKPLYYYTSPDLFVFASELKAILTHPSVCARKKIRKKTITSFLQLGYIQQPHTFFEDIFKFPAGHCGVVGSDLKLVTLPYWNVSHYLQTARSIKETDAFAQLKKLVTNAVESRLVADVPVGIFLSGGIDSSLVTAVASRVKKLKTFSIGFKESKFDEGKYADQVATHLGTDHHRYQLHSKEAVDLVERYIEHFDEPFADTSAIPTMLVSQLASSHVKVALTGDGGDETFLGYGSYTWANRLTNPAWMVARPAIHMLMKKMPFQRWKRLSEMFQRIDPTKMRRHIFSQEQYFFSDREIRELLLKDNSYYYDWQYDDFRYLRVLSEAERQSLFDFQFYLRDDLLVKVDRASMYFGLECRSPLLDQNLVQFAVNLPESLKKRNSITKYLLREMLFEMVPASFFDRPKWGFSVPLSQWLKEDLSYLMENLSVENLEKTEAFQIGYVRDLVSRFYRGDDYLYNRIWALIISQRFLLAHR